MNQYKEGAKMKKVTWACSHCNLRVVCGVDDRIPQDYYEPAMRRYCTELAVARGYVNCNHDFKTYTVETVEDWAMNKREEIYMQVNNNNYSIKDGVVSIRKDKISEINVHTIFAENNLSGHIVETLNSDMVVLNEGSAPVACHRYRVQIIQLNAAEIAKAAADKAAADKAAAEKKAADEKLMAEQAAKNANEAPPPLPPEITATLPDNSQATKELGSPPSGAVKGGLAAKIAAQNPKK